MPSPYTVLHAALKCPHLSYAVSIHCSVCCTGVPAPLLEECAGLLAGCAASFGFADDRQNPTLLLALQMALQMASSFCRTAHNIPPYSLRASALNASVSIFNVDWANNNPQPLSPSLVSCGALTAKPAQALPLHLESYVESAGQHGVVFASLGTSIIPGEHSEQCLEPLNPAPLLGAFSTVPWQRRFFVAILSRFLPVSAHKTPDSRLYTHL